MTEPSPRFPAAPSHRRIYCNRTLNLRSIRAIGYDMDYTLIHYRVEDWERRAYEHIKRVLGPAGWPVADLDFDPELVVRGLIIDSELGNIVKANRFGYVKLASHGTRVLSFEEQRKVYSRTRVTLSNPRFTFLNTLFSLSEGCLYLQLIDRLDAHLFPETEVLGYADLWRRIRAATDATHMEGRLKAEITADPDRFLELDPELPLALLDQRQAGKTLLLITNSEWGYSNAMMSYAIDRFLPGGMTWRSLFDVVIVGARKPSFFFDKSPVFEVATDEGLLRPCPQGIKLGGTYLGGNAAQIEENLGLSGDEILYVGDHIYTDVHVSKRTFSWRTALVLRELEPEIEAVRAFQETQRELDRLMAKKELLEFEYNRMRLSLQRSKLGYAPADPRWKRGELGRLMAELREQLVALDERIAPLAQASATLSNRRWGLLLRAGNDKSHLARQLERYADVYTSRVSNFLIETPFVYLRSPRGSLPHDPIREIASDPLLVDAGPATPTVIAP